MSAISTINSNLAAQSAALSIGTATQNVSNDTAALSSGNRIVNASTDVAALSIGSGLASQVNILNTALSVSSQGASLLQVADGALAQIQGILQQQQSVATQAQAGSLSATQLGFLDQEFQGLTQQINSLAGSTNFNGVNLLNGAIAGGSNITTNIAAGNATTPLQATVFTTTATSGSDYTSGDTLTINGVTLALKTSSTDLAGHTAVDSAANIAAALNASGAPQLANYHFSSDAAGNVLANYTGGATVNIPTLSVSKSASAITAGGASGVVSFTPGALATTIASASTNDTVVVNGVSIASTAWNSGASATVAGEATALASYLNSTNNAAWAGITFASDTTTGKVFAYYNGTTSPSLTITNSSTAAHFTSNVTSRATVAATIAAVADTDTVVVNGVSIAGATWNPADAATTVITQATALASYLNANPNAAWAGITFASDTTTGKIYAYSNNGTSPTLTITDSTTPASVTGAATTGEPIYLNNINPATIGETGLGAGSFSAVGTIQGNNLFVTDNSTATGNHGQAVDLSGLNSNAAFLGNFGGTGTIGAITATYNSGSTPSVTFSAVVGNDTYTTAAINISTLTASTNPIALNFIGKNTSTGLAEGGNFMLNIQGGQSNITSQTGANNLASAFNAALSGVSVYQNRQALSFNNNFSAQVGSTVTGTLTGASLSLNNSNFTNTLVSSVSVSAPSTGTTDAKISLTVGGQVYSTQAGVGNLLKTDTVITLVNANNPNQTITLTTGNISNAGVAGTGGTAIDLSSSTNAAAFQTALSSALGVSSSNAALSFQVGSSSSDTVGVSIGSATTSALFGGQTLDVKTQADATNAGNVVQNALNIVGALRANVGALETQFNFAQAAIQSAVANEGAAKSNLLDTNVATQSTQFATDQVQLQAGIAVLAQANQLQQNLLKLIQ